MTAASGIYQTPPSRLWAFFRESEVTLAAASSSDLKGQVVNLSYIFENFARRRRMRECMGGRSPRKLSGLRRDSASSSPGSGGNYRLANRCANEMIGGCETRRACHRTEARTLYDDALERCIILRGFWRRRAKGAPPLRNFAKFIGGRFSLSFAARATRSPRPRTSPRIFSLWCLKVFQRADQRRGRFRSLVLKALQNFLHDAAAKRRARKRGGDVQIVSWDDWMAEAPSHLSIPAQESDKWPPERIFDGAGRPLVVERALSRLGEECEKSGRRRVFDVLSGCLGAEREDVSYGKLSKRSACRRRR